MLAYWPGDRGRAGQTAGRVNARRVLVPCFFPANCFIPHPQNPGLRFCLCTLSPYFFPKSPSPDLRRPRAGHTKGVQHIHRLIRLSHTSVYFIDEATEAWGAVRDLRVTASVSGSRVSDASHPAPNMSSASEIIQDRSSPRVRPFLSLQDTR